MNIKFWGVRGTVPAPGPNTVRTGGNTSCLEVDTGEAEVIIIDAGTGIRALGLDLVQRTPPPLNLILLLSHTHWDHIQGLPFFAPARRPGTLIRILGDGPQNAAGSPGQARQPEALIPDTAPQTTAGGSSQAGSLAQRLDIQMSQAFFPLTQDQLAADLQFGTLPVDRPTALGARTTVEARRLSHPNGVLGFRIEAGDKVLAYASDVSHPTGGLDADIVALARDADLLIHDAHFSPEELVTHDDWGHSSWLEACQAATTADVGRLALFHHHPDRTDDEVDAIEADAQAIFPAAFAAREGMGIQL